MTDKHIFDQVVRITQELVRTDSLSGQEKNAARLVQEWMGRLRYDDVQVDLNGNVIGSIVGAGQGISKSVLFDAHMDTVPPAQPEQWTRDPFSGEIEGSRLYGLGSVDMKGSLAAMLLAAANIPRNEISGTIHVSASVGEEACEGLALEPLIKITQPDYVVIGEPTGFRLGFAQRGRATIVVETKGKSAHSSDPALGVNAVYSMAEVVHRFKKMDLPSHELMGKGVMELIDIISDPYPSASTIPHLCRARYDRRLVPGETPESSLEDIRQLVYDIEGAQVFIRSASLRTYTGQELTDIDFHPAWAVEEEGELVIKAKRALSQNGLDSDPFVVRFCSNGSYTAGAANIQTIIVGPPSISRAHAVDEYVDLRDLYTCFQVYNTLGQLLLSDGLRVD